MQNERTKVSLHVVLAVVVCFFEDHVLPAFLDREQTRRRAQQELLLCEHLIRELVFLSDLQHGRLAEVVHDHQRS